MFRLLLATLFISLSIISLGQNWNSGSGGDIYYNGGKVGIGTTSPTSKLEIVDGSLMIKSDPYAHIGLERSNGAAIRMGVTSGSFESFLISEGHLKFHTNGQAIPRVFIKDNGNVGIGTSNPTALLTVNGNMKVPFSWNLTESQFSREIIKTGWVNDLGDYISIKHGGNNSETYTYGLRISDKYGLEFGRDDYAVNFLKITTQGLIGVGTLNPDSKLTVKGDIHAEEVWVDLNVPGPDYVFEEDYDLPSLEDLQNYIMENKHLPEVPSAKEMEANGIDLGTMNLLLLKKVEELTLHLIEQNGEMKEMKKLVQSQQNEIDLLKSKIKDL